VGCGQDVHVLDGKIVDIEGDADSPISRGCLCPKGSAKFQLVPRSHRAHQVLYRAPGAAAWQTIPLDRAMQMVADRVQHTREATWEERNNEGAPLRRTLGIAHLGGATLDVEENYVIKKLFAAPVIVHDRKSGQDLTLIHGPRSGVSFGRGGATTFQQDLANSDCILIEGSDMAECHPVGFQWVMEAKHRGATIIHVDPRFTRTSAVADIHVPVRAGSDIAFLGGIVRYILENQRYFHDYVRALHQRIGDYLRGVPRHGRPGRAVQRMG
jgi:formate dehydrogenase major subunit